MGKYLILVIFAVLSKLSCGEETLDLGEAADYSDYDEPLTLPPPTLQPGCVMLDRPCGKHLPRCCQGVCKKSGIYQAVYVGIGIVEHPFYTCLRRGQKVSLEVVKIGKH